MPLHQPGPGLALQGGDLLGDDEHILPIRGGAGRDWRLWLALATVYLVWSSTYLAIRVMVETVPPLLGAGRRGRAGALVVGSVAAVVGHESPAEPAPRPFRDASGRER